jgi:hypothetical protein
VFTLFLPDALRVKKSLGKARHAAGVAPGEMAQRGPGTFWPQPEGNKLKIAPLVVALLAKAASLGVVARLDWRDFQLVRTGKNSVNTP